MRLAKRTAVLCALGVTAALLTAVPGVAEESAVSSVAVEAVSSAEEAAESTADSAAEDTAAESTAEDTAAESTADSTAEDAAAESTADSEAAAEDDAAEEDGAEAEDSEETTEEEAEEEAEEEEIPRPEYNALDYVTLGDYVGLTVEVEPIEVTEEQVDARIESELRTSEAGSDVLTEGTVEEGDIANIDYEGKRDGVAFDGGTAEGYDLEIGSGTFIEGFEEGLVGKTIGETVDLNLTFPEEYGNEELAGADVVFTVKINSVKRLKELDDELAKELSEGNASTVEEYREQIKGSIEEEELEARDENAKTELLTLAAEACEVSEYPQDLLDYTVNEITEYYQSYAAMYGVDFNTFLTYMLGMTEEDFPAAAEEMAKESIRQEFCINAIAELEGLLPEGDELMDEYDAFAQTIGFENGEDLVAQYGESTVKYAIAHNMVMDYLYEYANIVEKSLEEMAAEAEAEEEAEEEVAAESEAESAAEEDGSEAESVEEEAGSEAESAAEEAGSEAESAAEEAGSEAESVAEEAESAAE